MRLFCLGSPCLQVGPLHLSSCRLTRTEFSVSSSLFSLLPVLLIHRRGVVLETARQLQEVEDAMCKAADAVPSVGSTWQGEGLLEIHRPGGSDDVVQESTLAGAATA